MERRQNMERHLEERARGGKADLFHHAIRQADKPLRRPVHRTGRPGRSLLCRYGHLLGRAKYI